MMEEGPCLLLSLPKDVLYMIVVRIHGATLPAFRCCFLEATNVVREAYLAHGAIHDHAVLKIQRWYRRRLLRHFLAHFGQCHRGKPYRTHQEICQWVLRWKGPQVDVVHVLQHRQEALERLAAEEGQDESLEKKIRKVFTLKRKADHVLTPQLVELVLDKTYLEARLNCKCFARLEEVSLFCGGSLASSRLLPLLEEYFEELSVIVGQRHAKLASDEISLVFLKKMDALLASTHPLDVWFVQGHNYNVCPRVILTNYFHRLVARHTSDLYNTVTTTRTSQG